MPGHPREHFEALERGIPDIPAGHKPACRRMHDPVYPCPIPDSTTIAARPQPWVCPTPDLDLSDVEWTAREVEPGTPYDDEPGEMIDPGWYVLGFLPDHDPRDAPPVTIKIEGAYDEHGCDRGERLARRLVEVLSLAEPGDRYEVDISQRWRFLPLAYSVTVTDRLSGRVLLERTGLGYGRMLSAGLTEADGGR